MNVDEQFMEGFQFALIVLASLGHNPGIDAIAAQLMSPTLRLAVVHAADCGGYWCQL